MAFYAEKLGLAASPAAPEWTRFAMRGAALALRPTVAGEPARIELAIVASPLEARMAAVAARGVAFEGGIETLPDCRMAMLRDPEGNRVQLVDPTGDAEQGRWPHLSHAIVNAADFTRTVTFYRNVIGLRVSTEQEGWVEFDTGETVLAVHDRERADGLLLRPEQRITFALEDEDFEAWTAELRGRGVTFATAPMEQELGVQAEVEDADGWFVVLHGPAPEEPHEAGLAEEFEDEESGARTQVIRRPGESMTENVKKRTTPAKQARRAADRAGARSPDGTSRSAESERTPLPPLPRAPRPGGFPPRPAPPGGFAPRPSGPGGFTPRPPRPGGFAPRPGGPPRSAGPGGGPPRPPGASGPPRRRPDEK